MSNEPGNIPNVTEHPIKSKSTRKLPEKLKMEILKNPNDPKYYTCTPDPPKLV